MSWWLRPLQHSSCCLPILLFRACGLQGIAYDQLTEGENSSLDYRWVCMICWYYTKVDSWSIIAPLRGDCEDSGEGKSSQWAEILAGYMTVHYVWGERWLEYRSTLIHGQLLMVWLDGQGLEDW